MAYEGMANRDQQTGATTAAQLAGAAINPFNWYKYNPNLWSASRGQIKMPLVSGRTIKSVSDLVGKIPLIGSHMKAMDNALSSSRTGGLLTSKSVWWGLKQKNDAGLVGFYFPQDSKLVKELGPMMPRGVSGATAPPTSRNIARSGALNRPRRGYYGPGGGVGTPKPPMPKVTPAVMKATGFTGKIGQGIDRSARAINNVKWAGVGKGLVRGIGRTAATLGKGWAYLSLAQASWQIISSIAEPMGRAAFAVMDAGFRAYEGIPNPEMGGRLAMAYLSNGSATERQRSLQAISKAHINGRSALGGEAALVHKGY